MAANIRCQDRQPGTDGLENDDASGFVICRQRQGVGAVQESGHVVASAEETDPGSNRQPCGESLETTSVVLAHYEQVRASAERVRQCRYGVQQTIQTLLDETRTDEQYREVAFGEFKLVA